MSRLYHRIFALSLCLFTVSVSGCNTALFGNTPGITTPATQYSYDLPLKLIQEGECGLSGQTLYSIAADGTFSYKVSPAATSTETKSYKLSVQAQNDLAALLKKLNLALLDEASKPVPTDAPQTTECRTVEILVVQVNGKEKRFDRNGRKATHSKEYLAAMDTLKQYFEKLKTQPAPTPTSSPAVTTSSALPLMASHYQECEKTTQTVYEVWPDGRFIFNPDPTATVPPGGVPEGLQTRHLSQDDLRAFNLLLTNLNLPKLFESSQPIPADTPQTEECRTILNYTLQVNGKPVTYDRNGRQYSHTSIYREALEKLAQQLQILQKRYQFAGKQLYTVPLKVRTEGECGLNSYTRYEVKDTGEFIWALEKAQTLVAGPPPVQSRQLSEKEQDDLKSLLNRLALLGLALQSEPIPADAPQTKECRSVEKIELMVNGQMHTLDGRGSRRYRHNETYTQALAELQIYLENLSKK